MHLNSPKNTTSFKCQCLLLILQFLFTVIYNVNFILITSICNKLLVRVLLLHIRKTSELGNFWSMMIQCNEVQCSRKKNIQRLASLICKFALSSWEIILLKHFYLSDRFKGMFKHPRHLAFNHSEN